LPDEALDLPDGSFGNSSIFGMFCHFERAEGHVEERGVGKLIVKDEWENVQSRKPARTNGGERQKHQEHA